MKDNKQNIYLPLYFMFSITMRVQRFRNRNLGKKLFKGKKQTKIKQFKQPMAKKMEERSFIYLLGELTKPPIIRNRVILIICKYYTFKNFHPSDSEASKPKLTISQIQHHDYEVKPKHDSPKRRADASDYHPMRYDDRRRKEKKQKSFCCLYLCLLFKLSSEFSAFLLMLPQTIICIGFYYFQIKQDRNQMANLSESSRSYSILSEESQQMIEDDHRQEMQQQQQPPCSDQGNEYAKYYSVHAKVTKTNKFPFSTYLSNFKPSLTSQQLHSIFQSYFHDPKYPTSFVQKPITFLKKQKEFNQLFKKVPQNAVVFLRLEPCSEKQKVSTLTNYNGEIIHFKTVDKNKNPKTLIGWLKRKIIRKNEKARRLFFVILDEGELNSRFLKQNVLRKLAKQIKYFYVKVIKDNQELQHVNKLLSSMNAQSNILIDVEKERQYFSLYSLSKGEELNIPQVETQKRDLLKNITKIKQQENQLVESSTCCRQLGFRLRSFDALYVNYLKTTSNTRQQFIFEVQSFMKRRRNGPATRDNVEDKNHYLQHMMTSKRCKYCDIVDSSRNSKSKFRCGECSLKYQVDVPLCIRCNGDFHELVLKTYGDLPLKKMKIAYQNHLKNKKDYENQSVKETLLNLNQGLIQMNNLMEQLTNGSPQMVEMARKCNEAFLVLAMEQFNGLMFKESMLEDVELDTPRSTTSM